MSEIFVIYGWQVLLKRIIGAIISFIVMLLIKKLGDLLFKKESLS